MSDAKQNPRSEKSMNDPAGKPQGEPAGGKQQRPDIRSSKGQDPESRRDRDDVPHTAPGTADIERSSAGSQGHSDSLTDDPVGAFKERP